MARPLNITITESREELERRLQHETDARQQRTIANAVLAEARTGQDSSRDCPSAGIATTQRSPGGSTIIETVDFASY